MGEINFDQNCDISGNAGWLMKRTATAEYGHRRNKHVYLMDLSWVESFMDFKMKDQLNLRLHIRTHTPGDALPERSNTHHEAQNPSVGSLMWWCEHDQAE